LTTLSLNSSIQFDEKAQPGSENCNKVVRAISLALGPAGLGSDFSGSAIDELAAAKFVKCAGNSLTL
jgi:hypothetical protein